MTSFFKTARKGTTGIGYGLVVGMIGVVALTATTNIGDNVVALFDDVAVDLAGGETCAANSVGDGWSHGAITHRQSAIGFKNIDAPPGPTGAASWQTQTTVSCNNGTASAASSGSVVALSCLSGLDPTPGGSCTNFVPSLVAPGNQTLTESTGSAALQVIVSDVETAAGDLLLTASSDNTSLIDTPGLVLGGSDDSRTLTLSPVQGEIGSAEITLTLSDGTDQVTESFTLTVTAGSPVVALDSGDTLVVGDSLESGTPGACTAFSLINSGAVTARNIALALSGSDAGDFQRCTVAGSLPDCGSDGSNLAPLQTCQFGIQRTSATPGTTTATITVTVNNVTDMVRAVQGTTTGSCTPGSFAFDSPAEGSTFDVDQRIDTDCSTLGFAMWGGGGGGGAPRGGSGGYVTGILPLNLSHSYEVYVGEGGTNYFEASANAGSGGVASAIRLSGTLVAVAGGGGGAGSNGGGTGGHGGGTTSSSGAVAGGSAPNVNSETGGPGGGTTSAGAAGAGSRRDGQAGSGSDGGNGSDPCQTYPNRDETTGWGNSGGGYGYRCGDGGGGGGGAGYYGGGGGGSGPNGAGGGGGSSYRHPTLTSSGSMERGSVGVAPGTSSPHYSGSTALGGPGGNDGFDGRVVFYWQ